MYDLNQIERLLIGVEEQLRKTEAFVGLIREVKNSLEELRHAQEQNYLHEMKKMRLELDSIKSELYKNGLAKTSQYEQELNEARGLLDDPEWPIAVDEQQICKTKEMIERRSEIILDLFVCEHIKDKKFLDYGCGENFTASKAYEREASFALGYDINPEVNKHNNKFFTSKFEDVQSNGPYDIILLHDVLDHIVVIDPLQALRQVKSVLAPKGRIYIKNHPWSSRHGGHIYNQKNKAFIHLVFDEIELTRVCGLTAEHTLKITNPLETYRQWFKETGLNIISEIPMIDKVEKFFLMPSTINSRLLKHWNNPVEMKNQLEISSVEYVLESPELQQEIF